MESIFFTIESFSVTESVFIYSNYVIFVLDSKRDLIEALNKIIDFLLENNTIFKKEDRQKVDSQNIPVNLKVLLPLLKKFSIADDAERDELVDKMSNKQKTTLVRIVDPLMSEIEAYLDSLVDKEFTHEDSLISNLAELVAELRNNHCLFQRVVSQ